MSGVRCDSICSSTTEQCELRTGHSGWHAVRGPEDNVFAWYPGATVSINGDPPEFDWVIAA